MSWLRQHWLALVPVLLGALLLYLQLLQWQKHGDDYMLLALTLIVTFALWTFLILAILRYRKDVYRESVCLTKLENERYERGVQMDGLRRENNKLVNRISTHVDEIRDICDRHSKELEELKQQHAKNILDARRVVIHSAMWGPGGVQNRDQTARLQLFLEHGVKARVSAEFFEDFLHGHPKWLFVEFSCPCSGTPKSHTFQPDEEIDFESLCPPQA